MNEFERRISKLEMPAPGDSLDLRVGELFGELDAARHSQSSRPTWRTAIPRFLSLIRSNWKMSLRVSTIAVLGLLAMNLLTGWPFRIGGSVAFAQTKQSVREVQTIQYYYKQMYYDDVPNGGMVARQENGEYEWEDDMAKLARKCIDRIKAWESRADDPIQKAMLSRYVEILGEHIEADDPKLSIVVHHFGAVGGLERMQGIFPEQGVTIFNALTGQSVSMHPDQAKHTTLTYFATTSSDPDAEKIPLDRVRSDVISHLIKVPDDAVEAIGPREFDGVRAQGFERSHRMNGGTVKTEYWIHPKTRLPIQIEKRFFEDGSEDPSIYSVYFGFVYDEPLDPEIFSTSPPDGYETDDAEFLFHIPDAANETD